MKSFLKTFSLYGLIPVANKLLGFFLIPIYTSVFGPEDFGILEILRRIGMFGIILVHLEIYTAVSRYFFEYKEFKIKNKLISTGLWLTVITGTIVSTLLYINENFILEQLFENTEYSNIFKFVILWIPFTAINSFFNTMMRLVKDQNYFVIFSIIQMVLRVSSIILFVVVLKKGIAGVFMGQTVGALTGILSFGFRLRKYVSFTFKWSYVRNLLKFSLPLAPGILLIPGNKLIINYLIQHHLSYNELGLYSIAIRISGILMIISQALRLAWRPYLYELINTKKSNFKKEVASIYKLFLAVLTLFIFHIIIYGKEIIKIVAGQEYIQAYVILGFILLGYIIRPLKLIVGIGPEITKKTKYISFVEIFHLVFTVTMINFYIKWFGLFGIGITIFSGELIRILLIWIITEKQIKLPIPKGYTLITFCLIILTIIILINTQLDIYIRGLIFIAFLIFTLLYNRLLVQKFYGYFKNKLS